MGKIELIRLKREVEEFYATGTPQLDRRSCEMAADELQSYVCGAYPWIGVNEDSAFVRCAFFQSLTSEFSA
jgi:hypothetical protein